MKILSRRRGALSRVTLLAGSVVSCVLVIVGLWWVMGSNALRSGGDGGGGSVLRASFRDVFGGEGEKPRLEISLDDDTADTSRAGGAEESEISNREIASQQSRGAREEEKKISDEIAPGDDAVAAPTEIAGESSTETFSPRACNFSGTSAPTRALLINEIAWMGTSESAANEWMEIRNVSGKEFALRGAQIISSDDALHVTFTSEKKIPHGGFALAERTDDASVASVVADHIYTGALPNSGAWLRLFDAACVLLDEIDARNGWEKFGGDNASKRTLERNAGDLGWYTSATVNGTPREANGAPYIIVENSPPQPSPAPQPTPMPPPAPQPAPAPAPLPEPPPPPPAPEPAPLPPPPESVAVLISEVMAGKDGAPDSEFIELYNPNDTPIDITGWELRKRTSTGTETNLVDNGAMAGTIPAHGYFLIASPSYTGSPSPDIIYSAASASIAYTSNSAVLYSSDHASGAVVDEVNWAEIPKNQSYARDITSGTWAVSENPTPENSLP